MQEEFIFPPDFTNPPPLNRKSSAESHIWNHKPLRRIPNRRTSNPFVVLLRSIHQYLCRSSSIPPPFSFNPPPFFVVLRGSKNPFSLLRLVFMSFTMGWSISSTGGFSRRVLLAQAAQTAADVFLWKCMNCGLGFLSCLNITLLLMRVISILVIVLLVLWSNAHTFLHRDL
ncbi:unnamed protein product [Trifolium pratense]|uniref:Uncharacterized protein n=1 Tax=Trifolium pratense TaxID=57577 RepID=A0ACB0I8C3_TRIPR|nr:unnamed protein product [Trifolium pratense]